jgi:flavin reductase (DIM6/NTAB) family NADH-FMN oxidoreductase RutF/rubredoxin
LKSCPEFLYFYKKYNMITFEALFKISYGLYIVCSGDKNHGNGFISNTVFQVTSEPPKFAACCSKDNFTAGFITRCQAFSVSVLSRDASPDLFGRFGFKSGKDLDKMEGTTVKYGETGVPVVLDDTVACLECRVAQTLDVGTHLMFIGELVNAEILDDMQEPLTYLHYRQIRRGVAPKNAPTYIDKKKLTPAKPALLLKKYQCAACGYVYDEAIEKKEFHSLPAGWQCPSCGSEKEDFMELIT